MRTNSSPPADSPIQEQLISKEMYASGKPPNLCELYGMGSTRKRSGGNVRFGSLADIGACRSDVRFTPKSRHCGARMPCPLCAKSGHAALRQRLALFDHLVGGHEH